MFNAPYKSKDFMIDGNYLLLDEEKAWNHIDKRMRTAVRKAAAFNPQVVEVQGNEEDIKKFAEFCPRADTLPRRIAPNQKMFFCYLGEDLVGGLILTEVAGNWFLQFNAVTEPARKKQISSYLLWEMVRTFSGSKYKYLDIGASYRESLQKYFSGWRSKRYPILMKPPEIKPQINITPFENRFLGLEGDPAITEDCLSKKWQGREYTIFPRGMYAVFALIRWLSLEGKIGKDGEVCIKTTSGSKYVSGCVTSAIEQTCGWSHEITDKTRAIFVIHEFGFPHPEIKKFREICDEKEIPLIEDCAYLWDSGEAGRYGDYLIYSLTKIFPVQFGGMLVGKKFEPDYIWNNFACHDAGKEILCKKQLAYFLPEIGAQNQKRVDNYRYMEEIFGAERAFFKLEDGVVPGAFVLRVENGERAEEIAEYVRKFGIECGNYWGNSAIFLPIHQVLEQPQLDYVIGAALAMFRNGCGVYNLTGKN